jgi:DNA-binding FrmR family transcriptional regulator
MKQNCKAILSHISRLEGQLRRLKVDIDENTSCENIVQLSLSAAKSFDSLRAKIIEAYIQENFLHGKAITLKEHKELESLYTLIKA